MGILDAPELLKLVVVGEGSIGEERAMGGTVKGIGKLVVDLRHPYVTGSLLVKGDMLQKTP